MCGGPRSNGEPALPPGCSVAVMTHGHWWTQDDPSLCIPRPDGNAVRVWCAGEGPSVLLVPPAARSHDVWAGACPSLAGSFTLHAVDRIAAPLDADAAHLVAAADAVGARRMLGWPADARVLCEAGARARGPVRVAVLVATGTLAPEVAAMTAIPVSAPGVHEWTAADTAAIVERLDTAEGATT